MSDKKIETKNKQDFNKDTKRELASLVALRESDFVEKLFKKGLVLEGNLNDFKDKSFNEITKFDNFLIKKNKVKLSKGNRTFINLDETKRIKFLTRDIIKFDSQLQQAKTRFNQFIEKDKNISPVVTDIIKQAFSLDKEGKINTTALIRLAKFKTKKTEEYKEFQECQVLILESIKPAGTKNYLLFQTRDDAKSEVWRTVKLSLT